MGDGLGWNGVGELKWDGVGWDELGRGVGVE